MSLLNVRDYIYKESYEQKTKLVKTEEKKH